MASSVNNCVICLEPLMAAKGGENGPSCDLGAAVPCGHPSHVSCWKEWEKLKTFDGSGVPCPTCRQRPSNFIRIHLAAESEKRAPPLEEVDINVSDSTDDEDEEVECMHENTGKGSPYAPVENRTPSNPECMGMARTVPLMKRRSKWQKLVPPKKNNGSKLPPQVHKKLVRYKYLRNLSAFQLKASQARVKMLTLEAENRKRCHHEDLIELEHTQLLNFKLEKELEQFQDSARIKRNLIAALCFGIGVLWGKVRLFGIRY